MSDTPAPQPEQPAPKLTAKQRAFVEAYFACGFNATEAARRAGYSAKTARSVGAENLTKPDIQAEISRRMDEAAMPANEVLARLAAQARGSMADFLRVDEEQVTLTWSLATQQQADAVLLAALEGHQPAPTDQILHTATVTRSVARLDLLAARDKLGLIKKYSIDKDGKVAIELYDAQAALGLIGKHHRLFVERTELTGKDGEALFKVYERTDTFDPDAA